MARRRPDPEAGLAAVRALRTADDATVEGELPALFLGWGPVVASAAELAGTRGLTSMRPALLAAWSRLEEDPVTRDPGCVGKAACAAALDTLDCQDRAAFLRGSTYVQMQPVWGKSEDKAGELRARCLFALARFGGVDALVALAGGLADPLPEVRTAAAQALRGTGEPAAAALALLVIRRGDESSAVVADALGSLLALRPDDGVGQAARLLRGPDEELAELAALALGQSRVEGALELLDEALSTAWRSGPRRTLLLAMGLLRSEAARDRLLGVVRAGPLADARAAIEALAAGAVGAGVRERVEAAARGRGLDAAIEAAFEG